MTLVLVMVFETSVAMAVNSFVQKIFDLHNLTWCCFNRRTLTVEC
jgi:hypothetical protein